MSENDTSDQDEFLPIATRTRNSKRKQPTDNAWCTGRCTDRGESSQVNEVSLPPSPYSETTFPCTPLGPTMDNAEGNEENVANNGPPYQQALFELIENMHARIQQQDRQLANVPPKMSGAQPPIFRGSAKDDIEDWLDSFERYALFNHWTPEEQLLGLMMFVGGNAKRFCQRLPNDTREDIDMLKEALREGFTSEHQNFLRRQELNARKQGVEESLDTYVDDIDARAQKLHLTDAETMQCFIQGLQSDLKEHVILTRPETYNEAVDAARLKNSLRNCKPKPHTGTQEMLNMLVSTFTKALNTNSQNPVTKSAQQGQSDINRYEFLGLKNDIQALQTQLSAQNNQTVNQRPRDRTFYSFNTSNFRNNRTTDGRPICGCCGKVGHHASRCFSQPRNNFRQTYNNSFRPTFRQLRDNGQFRSSSQQYNPNQPRFPALEPPPRPPPPPPIRSFETCTSASSSKQRTTSPKYAYRNIKTRNQVQNDKYDVMVDGFVNEVPIKLLIDTGAAITTINSEFWKELSHTSASNDISHGKYAAVQTANGEIVKIEGTRNLLFHLGNCAFTFQTYLVPQLNYAVILGRDFLEKYNCVIDFKANCLKIGQNNVINFSTTEKVVAQDSTNPNEI